MTVLTCDNCMIELEQVSSSLQVIEIIRGARIQTSFCSRRCMIEFFKEVEK